MKRFALCLVLALSAIFSSNAETFVFKVLSGRWGSSTGREGGVTWSKSKLKAKTITIDNDSLMLTVTFPHGKTEEYKMQDEWNNNNTEIVQAHDIMTGQGWEVVDMVVVDEFDHKMIIRMRKHSAEDKTQFFIYKAGFVYAYDVKLQEILK